MCSSSECSMQRQKRILLGRSTADDSTRAWARVPIILKRINWVNETSEHRNASPQSVYFSSKNNLLGATMVLTRWLLLQDNYTWNTYLGANFRNNNKKRKVNSFLGFLSACFSMPECAFKCLLIQIQLSQEELSENGQKRTHNRCREPHWQK